MPEERPEVRERVRRAADALRPYIGSYVAQKDGVVLVAKDSGTEVVAWLRENVVDGAAVLLVPIDPVTATTYS